MIARRLVRACSSAAYAIQEHETASTQALVRKMGKADSGANWRRFTSDILNDAQGRRPTDLRGFSELVETLTTEAELTQGAFWYELADSMRKVINQSSLEDLLPIARKYAFLNCKSQILFDRLVLEGNELLRHLEFNKVSVMVDLVDVLGKAKVSDRTLFRTLADYLIDDMELLQAFTDEQLIQVVGSMAEVGVVHDPLLHHLGRHRLHKVALPTSLVARLARAYGRLGYRHDTFFKNWIKDIIAAHNISKKDDEGLEHSFTAGEVALVLEAMISTKRYRGKTEWWDAEQDFKDLVEVLARRLGDEFHRLNAVEVASACWTLGKVKYVDDALCRNLMDQLRILLTTESFEVRTLGRASVEKALDGIVHMGKGKRKDIDLDWLMKWTCDNVYTLPVHDVVMINRWIADFGCSDHSYYEIFITYFLEKINELTRDDVKNIQDTYNKVKMSDEKMGRHFFYMLGNRYQNERIDHVGVKKQRAVVRIG